MYDPEASLGGETLYAFLKASANASKNPSFSIYK